MKPPVDQSFYEAIETYHVAANAIDRVGYYKARSIARDSEFPTDPDAPIRFLDLLAAVELGMTLHEHLEFDSPESWLKRRVQENAPK